MAHGVVTAGEMVAAGGMGRVFSGLAGPRRVEPGSDAVLAGLFGLVPVSYTVVLVSHTVVLVSHVVVHVEHVVVHVEHTVVLVEHAVVHVEYAVDRVRSCKHRKPP